MKTVEDWAKHYDAKPDAMTNPIELVEHCASGKPFDKDLHWNATILPTIERLELEKHHHFLEIGCGTGLFLTEIENKVKRAVGTDISKRLLYSFETKSERMLCAAHELPFDKETFDRILMYSVAVLFESFEYFKNVVLKILPLLRKNGIFLIGDLLLGPRHPKSQYMYYDKHQLIDFLDSLDRPYSIMAQSTLKRTINRRYDVIVYND